MDPKDKAKIIALLRNFDNWLEEHSQYEYGDAAARIEIERDEIERAITILKGDG